MPRAKTLGSRLRGNDDCPGHSRLRGNDDCPGHSRLRANDGCPGHSRASGNPAAFLAVSVLALLLSSCGFHLRGAATYNFNTVYVNASGSPPLGAALRKALEDTGSAKVAEDPKAAQVIVDVPTVVDDKEVLSLSQSGAVREYQLVKRASFRVHDADGNDWLPAGEVIVRRAYTFNETEVLARDAQEQRLLREMQQDIVQQLVRRLQAARKPA